MVSWVNPQTCVPGRELCPWNWAFGIHADGTGGAKSSFPNEETYKYLLWENGRGQKGVNDKGEDHPEKPIVNVRAVWKLPSHVIRKLEAFVEDPASKSRTQPCLESQVSF